MFASGPSRQFSVGCVMSAVHPIAATLRKGTSPLSTGDGSAKTCRRGHGLIFMIQPAPRATDGAKFASGAPRRRQRRSEWPLRRRQRPVGWQERRPAVIGGQPIAPKLRHVCRPGHWRSGSRPDETVFQYPRSRPETDVGLASPLINSGARLSWPSSSACFTAISSRPPSSALWRPRECADDRHRNSAAGLPQYQRFPGPRLRRLSRGLEPRDRSPQRSKGSVAWSSDQSITSNVIPRLSISTSRSPA
jgi:hypothetical protein